MTHPAKSLVTEEPRREPASGDGPFYTARRTPGTDPPQWAVFQEGRFAPVGYLEAVYDPWEEAWGLAVTDGNLRRIGEHGKRDNPGVPPYAGSYHHALTWIIWRGQGIV